MEGIPARFGKIKQDLSLFDSQFFLVHGAQAEKLDPQIRLLLEVSYEALVDAGISLNEIKGTRTGVYVGTCSADALKGWSQKKEAMTGYENTGCASCMLSNRLSYFYDLGGPSETIDTACSSSLVALHRAVTDLETGICDYAIVGGTSVILWPSVSWGLNKLKMLSPDGSCKAFDASANGFARAEGVIVLVLTNGKNNGHHPYAKILGTGVNSCGWNPGGITVPKAEAQKRLFREVCQKAAIVPGDIEYVEAHGTGTVVGDGEELTAIYDVYGRENTGLIVGSVKSNMGHCEGAAGLAGVVKTLLCFEQEILVPNLHLQTPNPKLQSMRVMSDPLMGWQGSKAAVNSFGFGGTNAHVILEKISNRSDGQTHSNRTLGLTRMAHRTREGLYELKKHFLTAPFSIEVVNLENREKLPFREIVELPDDPDVQNIAHSSGKVYFACSGNGSQWKGMGLNLYHAFPVFKTVMDQCSEAIGIQLAVILSEGFRNASEILAGLVAVQIGLIELLKIFGIHEDQIEGYLGHSAGEIVCSYLDQLTTLEETMRIAYCRGRAADQTGNDGAMAAVGLSKEKMVEFLKLNKYVEKITVACINSPRNVTISGHKSDIANILVILEKENIFCRLLDTLNKAYHSPLFAPDKFLLETKLSEIFNGKTGRRSQKWATAILNCETDVYDYHYQVDSVLEPVDFIRAIHQVPQNAIIVEIGPHSILKTLIKDNRPDLHYISLMKKDTNDFDSFREGLGKLWKLGMNVDFAKTDAKRLPLNIRSKLVSWNHADRFSVPVEKDFVGGNDEYTVIYNLVQDKDRYLRGHIVGGKCLLPATSYLCAMWDAFRKRHGIKLVDDKNYSFVDFEIVQAVQVGQDSVIELIVKQFGNQYELSFKEDIIARVKIDLHLTKSWEEVESIENNTNLFIDQSNFYRIIESVGYGYLDEFQVVKKSICSSKTNVSYSLLSFENRNWVTLLDGALQAHLLSPDNPISELRVPVRIRSISLNPHRICEAAATSSDNQIPMIVQFDLGCAKAPGIEIWDMETKEIQNESKAHEQKIDIKHEHSVLWYGHTRIVDQFVDDYLTFLTNYSVILCRDLIKSEELSEVGHYKKILKAFNEWGQPTVAVDEERLEFYRAHSSCISVRMLEYCYLEKRQAFIENPLLVITQHPEYARYYADELVASFSNDKTALSRLISVVRENCINQDLNILEIGTGTGGFTRLIAPHIYNDRFITTDITETSQIAVNHKTDHLNLLYEKFNLNEYDRYKILNKYDVDLVLASNSLHTGKNIEEILSNIFANLKDGAFVVFYEYQGPFCLTIWGMDSRLWAYEDEREYGLWMSQDSWVQKLQKSGFEIVSYISDGGDRATLFFVRKPVRQKLSLVEAPSIGQFDRWSTNIKSCDQPALLVANSIEQSGVIGFTRSLNKEIEGNYFHCVLADQLLTSNHIGQIERLGLVTNVFYNNRLGTPCVTNISYQKNVDFLDNGYYLTFPRKGDFSYCQWVSNAAPIGLPISVKYSALNFKDVMLVSGKISKDVFSHGASKKGDVGFEFSGCDEAGRRYMGFARRALANKLETYPDWIVPIPEGISYEDAATIPIVYKTVYYALFDRANIRAGQSILIHSGTGGVGQAAIHVCQGLGCKIFITCHVSKRKVLQDLFPQITDDMIFDSRTTDFEEKVMRQTNGRGVDIVLNSLSDDKLHASMRCVARGGHFLELGKYDLMKHSSLDMNLLSKNIAIHGIDVDQVMINHKMVNHLLSRIVRGIQDGLVRPLSRDVFSFTEVEDAFRFMGAGKHIGKVLVKMEGFDSDALNTKMMFYHDPKDTGYYLVTGGLGGFGLALLQWLADRGVRKFLVTSRRGVSNGEQERLLNLLRKRGVEIVVSTINVSDERGVKTLMDSVQGNIRAVYHLAMFLEDRLFKNMTQEKWDAVVRVKAEGAIHLDRLTRLPTVKYFVAFSSVVNRHGNAGQTSYTFGNSVIEEVCRLRAAAGYHALAIQWGVIGNVGFVANNAGVRNVLREFYAPISIHEALQFIDDLLVNRITSHCVYYNGMPVRADQKSVGCVTADEIVHQICKIVGIDLKVCDVNNTLEILGIDSLQSVEIQTILLRTLHEVLPLKKISSMTIKDIKILIESKLSSDRKNQVSTQDQKVQETHSLIGNIHYNDSRSAVYLFLGFGVDYTTLNFPRMENMNLNVVCWHNGISIEEIGDSIKSDIEKNQYERIVFLTHSSGYHIAKAVLAQNRVKINKFVAAALAHEKLFRNFLDAESIAKISETLFEKEYVKMAFYIEKHLPIGKVKQQSILLSKTVSLQYLPPNLVLQPRDDVLSEKSDMTTEISGNHQIDSFDMREIYSYLEG